MFAGVFAAFRGLDGRRHLLIAALCCNVAALAACSDAAVEPRGADATADASSVGTADGAVGGGSDASVDVQQGGTFDAASGDATTFDVVQTVDGGTTDAGAADAGSPDGGSADAGSDAADCGGDCDAASSGDAAGDAAGADGDATGGPTDPCGVCPWDEQPSGDHPGAKGPYDLLEPKKIDYGTAFGEGYKEMLVFEPLVAGPHPVLFFVPGKSLYATGGLIGKLGHAYEAMMQHVARHGVIAVFVRVEQGLIDGDHARMAKDLLQAQGVLLQKVSTADPSRIAYAGHSMGGKVVVIAAAEAIAGDKDGKIADPKLVVPMNLSNEKPPLGVYLDATAKAAEIGKDAPVFFDLLTTADDVIAPLDASGKPNTQAVYDALKMKTRQLIVLHGTGKDDPNPQTKPELTDDHAAPLSIEGKSGGAADFVMPASHLDALDWYGYWKHLVGALRYHFLGGDSSWAYGPLRTHGGTMADGTVITHEVKAQAFTTLP